MRVIVNNPEGQALVEIGNGKPDPARVVWDERKDGTLPADFDAAKVGGYSRDRNRLVFDQRAKDADTAKRAQALADEQAAIIAEEKTVAKVRIEQRELKALAKLAGIEMDAWAKEIDQGE